MKIIKKGDIFQWYDDPSFEWKVISESPNEEGDYLAECMNNFEGRYFIGDVDVWQFTSQNWIYIGNINGTVAENSAPSEAQKEEPKEFTRSQRWTIAKWGKQDVLMDNGVVSSLSLE